MRPRSVNLHHADPMYNETYEQNTCFLSPPTALISGSSDPPLGPVGQRCEYMPLGGLHFKCVACHSRPSAPDLRECHLGCGQLVIKCDSDAEANNPGQVWGATHS